MVDKNKNLGADRRIKLLDGFSVEERMEFLAAGKIREFFLHDIITSENQEDMKLYLILDGEVSIWRKNVPIKNLKSGDVFNEIKIFFPRSNGITVRAEKHSSLLRFERSEIFDYFNIKPERLFKIFTLNTFSILIKKLDYYEEKLIHHYFESLKTLTRSG